MKSGRLLFILLLLLLVPLTAHAGCMDIIKHAEKSMAVTKKNMRKLKEKDDKDTVKNMLADAKELLKDARRLCGKDTSFFDKTGGTSKALAAESLISSADLVIKAN